MPDSLDDIVEDLPPSCKLVVRVMADRDQLARAPKIAEWAWLSERTVYEALARLEERDLIERKRGLEDRREHLYRLYSRGEDSERPW